MTGGPAPCDFAVEDLTVRFGGHAAVDGASLAGRAGTVTGLIGPNGAGKTTIFNACTGLVRPQTGHVRLGGQLLDGHSASRRAQLGLGRTFQRVALWDSMTVAENVVLGLEAGIAGRRWRSLFLAGVTDRTRCSSASDSAMERCGVGHLADRPVCELATGQRRLVELARTLASGFRYLLLDEPSSGLDDRETERIGGVLAAVAGDGIGVLLIEHDISLVRSVCSYTYVLDFGRMIEEGPTESVLGSDVVQAAYLGLTKVS